MISRGKKQVKRKTLLKVIYLKKLKSLLENNKYWGFCSFVSSENKIKKNYLLELNSVVLSKGVLFYKVRASYLNKLLVVSNVDSVTLGWLSDLLKNAFVLLVTNNLTNVINFPFKEYAETKLVVYAWKLKTQLFHSNIFSDRKICNAALSSRKNLVYTLRENVKLVRLLNKNFKKE